MTKTTKQQFQLFKSECEKWFKVFELNSFEFRFYWEKLDSRASVYTNQVKDGVIVIKFSTEFDIKENIGSLNDYIKRMAKHEALHCLVAEFSEAGWERFTTKEEIFKLEEKLVNKLEKLIK